MAEESLFHHFFATLGQGSVLHAADVNAEATTRLEQVLKSPVDAPGRGILLRAPRAGFGKTHLIATVQHRLSSSHEFLPLTLLDGARIDTSAVVENALRRLTRQLPAGGGLTALDLQARRLLALSLQPLVSSGEVPCQDRESALSALRLRPVETFDFHQPQAVTAQWTRENFEILGPRLALELCRRTGTALNETSFWLAALFHYAVAPPDHPGRAGMIIHSATGNASVERFAALLALLSLVMRVVLVADDLEGMHADPPASLRLGSFLAAVRQDAPRVDAIVSVNDDIWNSSFQSALSGGLLDRIGEVEIRLGPLTDQGIISLLEERVPGRGQEWFGRLTLEQEDRYSRKVLRLVSERFEFLSLSAGQVVAPASSVATPFVQEAASPADEPPASVREEIAAAVEATEAPPVAIPPEPASPFEKAPLDEIVPVSEVARVPAVPIQESVPAVSPFTIDPEPEVTPPVVIQPASEATQPVSPFTAFTPAPEAAEFTPARQEPSVQSLETASASSPSGEDRIDDLLRQFRDRYGRE